MFFLKTIEFAKKKARETWVEHSGGNLPVDVYAIAEAYNIEIIEKTFEDSDISGLIKRSGKDGTPVIVVKESDSVPRKRFTIAHELGHFILHVNKFMHVDEGSEVVYFRNGDSSDASKIKEIQANQFAAELLMPEDLIVRDLKLKISEGENLEEIINSLASDYGVSKESMGIRIGKFVY